MRRNRFRKMESVAVRTRVFLALFLLAGAIGFVFWDTIVDESLLLMLGNSTVYSSGYSEEQFDEIQIGQSSQRVAEMLGVAFEESQFQNENGDTVKAVEYSKSAEDSHYRIRMILFIDDRVSEKVKAVHID